MAPIALIGPYTAGVPGYLEQLIDYNSWATGRLLDVLGDAPSDMLDATAPGVYGTVEETLTHLLNAERSYVARLSGATSPDSLELLDLAGLRREAIVRADELQALAQRLPEPAEVSQRRQGPVTAATVLTQLIQHGCEHRAQVATILGAHGIALPHLDPWAHGRARAGLPPLA